MTIRTQAFIVLSIIFALGLPSAKAQETPVAPEQLMTVLQFVTSMFLEEDWLPGSGNSEPTDPGDEDPSDGTYELSQFDIHFGVQWPTPPTTNTTINVPADMSFSSAVSNSNVRVIVAPGYSGGGATNWGNDVDVVMDNSATITSTVAFHDSQRIRWTGGVVLAQMTGNGFTDILIDNVRVETSSGSATNWSVTQVPFQRLALINSSFLAGSQWGVYVRPTVSRSQNHQDMIVANIITRSDAYQAARIMAVNRLVIVDSIGLNPDSQLNQSGWRLHYGCDQVYAKNVIGRGLFLLMPNGSDAAGNPQVLNAVFDNWHQYQLQSSSQLFANHTTAQNTGVVMNSRLHWTGGAGSLIGISPLDDGGNNTRVGWDGVSFDFSQMPGKNSISDYGANH